MRAQASLEKSLKLGEAEGYTRIYIGEGKPLQRLLERTVRSSFAAHRPYAEKLLAGMGEARIARTAEAQDGLIEPLTPRELDVLRLLTGGFSNRQISEALVLSEGTIKFHVHNVLEKLGVHSRAEAIARATKDHLL